MTKLWAAVVAATVFLPATAFSAEIDLTDPTIGTDINSSWKTSYTVTDPETGVDVTLSSTGGYLYQDGSDGIGVFSHSDWNGGNDSWGSPYDDWAFMGDEIDENESLTISFSENVVVESIAFTDLYDEGRLPMVWFYPAPDETGSWSLVDAGGTVLSSGSFAGEQERYVSNGELALSLDLTVLLGEAIKLVSTNNSQFKGFSVASISFSTSSVPELGAQGLGASAFLLFGAALLLSDRRRRQLSIEHA